MAWRARAGRRPLRLFLLFFLRSHRSIPIPKHRRDPVPRSWPLPQPPQAFESTSPAAPAGAGRCPRLRQRAGRCPWLSRRPGPRVRALSPPLQDATPSPSPQPRPCLPPLQPRPCPPPRPWTWKPPAPWR
ncbi:hypothetical protein BRADI_2g11355v3 [Brachypodium distachyon]|uniref:Uncharacterized protein n=1 Tax=Brachypodium distachyon TaxID=15368 RepID=A0A0Q3MI01_BRADI|nr:hypothetical protein BRADI_2g11355v3 [Brachypodium distachyon]